MNLTFNLTVELTPELNLAFEFSHHFATYGVPNKSSSDPLPREIRDGLDKGLDLGLFRRGEHTVIRGPRGESLHQGAFYYLTEQGLAAVKELGVKVRQ
ncbi:hypothetical protein [Mesorhizobium sp. M8A.F.Ca.ET.021.01.1.1]|uniref:hypothetical protein n=1 Tax=Mesorhizobium sp. M8A.F.Ca.ET.021.01.1.1 TaxID=2496757 RepID=UPI001AECA96D|nr:hypothetical protein [Mesorhizobium sp. M8A.F.Ca.ET.021.01.1.1]